jgi:hypothetical protein
MGRGVGPTAFDWPTAASRKTSRRASLPVGAVAVRARPRSVVSSNLAGIRLTTGRPTSASFEWGSVGRFPQQHGRGDQNHFAADGKPNVLAQLIPGRLRPTERVSKCNFHLPDLPPAGFCNRALGHPAVVVDELDAGFRHRFLGEAGGSPPLAQL